MHTYQGGQDPERRRIAGILSTVVAGAMVGATARLAVDQALPHIPGSFPWATFWTNLSGSFLLGLLAVLVARRLPRFQPLLPGLTTGLIGSYTTMSTYLVETARLLVAGHAPTGIAYAVASLAGGLILAGAGMWTGGAMAKSRSGRAR